MDTNATAPFGEVLTAIVTPFTEDGAVDHRTFWELARFLVSTGSDGLVVCGTTGESPTLTHDEKAALFRGAVEAVGERAVVVAGTGTYDTRESVEMSRVAADAGCHAVMAVTPYYSKPPQRGLVAHFTAVAEATHLPLLLYNIPGRTSRLIEVDTLAELSRHPKIVAVKDAVEDIEFTRASRAACEPEFAIYSGSDHMTLPIIEAGGVGVVSVASHLVGREVARMVTAARTGEWDEARRLHDGLLPLFEALFVEPNPMPVKAALNAFWDGVGGVRLPLVEAEDETVALIKDRLATAQSL